MTFIPNSDFFLDIAQSKVPGHETVQIQGRNPSVGTSFEDLWEADGTMVYPIVAEQWEILSSSGADASAGEGARTVLITYLDDSYDQQTEIVTLNGTTAVNMVATDAFRPLRVNVLTWGSVDATNLGDITLRVTGGGATRCMVAYNTLVTGNEFGLNFSHNGRYTVPAGKSLFITGVTTNVSKNDDAEIIIQTRPFGLDGFLTGSTINNYQNIHQSDVSKAMNENAEKTDIRFRARSTNTGTPVNIFISAILIDN